MPSLNGSIEARTAGPCGNACCQVDDQSGTCASVQDIGFEWLYWPQAEQPFDKETLAYIAALDADKDLEILAAHRLKLRPECERVLKVGERRAHAHARQAETGMLAHTDACACLPETCTDSRLMFCVARQPLHPEA